ncbi:MAG: metallophosphoesterase [candidate division Zixibacteria bacterium]|nr:metallophosphoesterase [candidate division Zixibacteria bacterium]MDH3936182.1 metallophosphoesterase [candidate division Zixibacteria bacterium]MDH4032974.1 metallophosphoesterase [candidate division Zixibacteria bacterium]
MKLAFISDTHFGDTNCALIDHANITRGNKFDLFAQAAGTGNDFLVVMGDIFDFSVSSYEDAYRRAKVFFELVKKENIAKSILYVPGNHDFDMWHTVQQEFRIIHQVRRGKPAEWFRWSLPGFIDDRKERGNKRGVYLPGPIDGPINPDAPPDANKLFLNGITLNPAGGGEATNFYVAYPNLYMITDKESLLITHGHYLEAFWSLSGEWLRKIAQKDLPQKVIIEDLVAFNVPLCQASCSSIGQAGKLTPLVQKIEHEVKYGNLKRVKRYLNRIVTALDEMTKLKWYNPETWVREWLTDLVANKVEKEVIKGLEEAEDTRYSEEFITKKEVLMRFKRYFQASLREIQQLKDEYGLEMSQPQRVIFGHTHRPIKWLDPKAPNTTVNKMSVRLYNTGGWLYRKNPKTKKTEFCGAEVFTYNSDDGFASTRIE